MIVSGGYGNIQDPLCTCIVTISDSIRINGAVAKLSAVWFPLTDVTKLLVDPSTELPLIAALVVDELSEPPVPCDCALDVEKLLDSPDDKLTDMNPVLMAAVVWVLGVATVSPGIGGGIETGVGNEKNDEPELLSLNDDDEGCSEIDVVGLLRVLVSEMLEPDEVVLVSLALLVPVVLLLVVIVVLSLVPLPVIRDDREPVLTVVVVLAEGFSVDDEIGELEPTVVVEEDEVSL